MLRLTDHLEELEVVQRDLTSSAYPNLHVLQDAAAALDVHNKVRVACNLLRPAAQLTGLLMQTSASIADRLPVLGVCADSLCWC